MREIMGAVAGILIWIGISIWSKLDDILDVLKEIKDKD
jgi:hypothetical protein